MSSSPKGTEVKNLSRAREILEARIQSKIGPGLMSRATSLFSFGGPSRADIESEVCAVIARGLLDKIREDKNFSLERDMPNILKMLDEELTRNDDDPLDNPYTIDLLDDLSEGVKTFNQSEESGLINYFQGKYQSLLARSKEKSPLGKKIAHSTAASTDSTGEVSRWGDQFTESGYLYRLFRTGTRTYSAVASVLDPLKGSARKRPDLDVASGGGVDTSDTDESERERFFNLQLHPGRFISATILAGGAVASAYGFPFASSLLPALSLSGAAAIANEVGCRLLTTRDGVVEGSWGERLARVGMYTTQIEREAAPMALACTAATALTMGATQIPGIAATPVASLLTTAVMGASTVATGAKVADGHSIAKHADAKNAVEGPLKVTDFFKNINEARKEKADISFTGKLYNVLLMTFALGLVVAGVGVTIATLGFGAPVGASMAVAGSWPFFTFMLASGYFAHKNYEGFTLPTLKYFRGFGRGAQPEIPSRVKGTEHSRSATQARREGGPSEEKTRPRSPASKRGKHTQHIRRKRAASEQGRKGPHVGA